MSYESTLLQHLFGRPDIESVAEEQLAELVNQYPYFAHSRWFQALKACRTAHTPDSDAVLAAGLYTSLPLRLMQFLNHPPAAGKQEEETEKAPAHDDDRQDALEKESAALPEPVAAEPLIQPLYARDYFAYTGQKLPDRLEDDKRPTMEQLHSFTGWLRALKRNPGTTDPDLRDDAASMAARLENEDAGIRKHAEESLKTSNDIVTEAMAEVRISNGQPDKAIVIYEKLSLSNPEKSAYFAQKIAELKNNT